MNKKGFINWLLVLVILITTIFPYNTVKAEQTIDDGTVQLGLRFDQKTGLLTFQAVNKTASSGTRYVSVGWIIRKDKVVNGSNPVTATANPLKDSKYVRLDIYGSYPNAASGVTKTDAPYSKVPGSTLTTITFTKDALAKKLEESGIGPLKTGETVYISAIFKVKVNGVLGSTEYTTLEDIRGAKSWSNKGGFYQYYDQSVTFYMRAPVEVKRINAATGSLIDSESTSSFTLKNSKSDDGDWPVGIPVTEGIKLVNKSPSRIYTSNGKTWSLKGSYQRSRLETTTYAQAASIFPNFKTTNVTERKPAPGPAGIVVYILYDESTVVKCNCDTELNIPDSSNIGGEVLEAKIGKEIPVNIRTKLEDEDYDKWIAAMKTATNTKLKIEITRTDKGSSNTGSSPILSGSPTIGTFQPITNDNLLRYFNGKTSLTYKDNLSNYPIPEDGKVEFEYNAKLTVTYTAGGVNYTVECDNGEFTTIKFFRKKKLDTNLFGTYTSNPSYWSEIKEGSPNNETFEAMAGTPTTRNLYFASGGSEFIVNIETEYVPNETATRSYKSYFSSVPSGWNMAVITGGRQKDSAPSKPSARRMTDISGAGYTETVTQHSAPYVKVEGKPASGTPGKPGYVAEVPPVMGTEYWWVQEGYSKQVGGYEDNWTQTSTFDYTKINKAQVWKIDRSKVDGMTTLIGTDEVTASIQQGDPVLFSNIAASNTSAAGRLRYSLEPGQHDTVVWNEGNSDNRDANSNSDNYVNEKAKFAERRAMTTNVTAISDFLILQTSSGDQSVMYFDKVSNTAKTTDALNVPKTSKVIQWDNNSNSAAKWSTNQVNIGSYNGNFGSPSTKYTGNGSRGTVSTIFDSVPAGLSRPSRPSGSLLLYAAGLNPFDTLPNGLYMTGVSTIFYKNILNHGDNNMSYSISYNNRYAANGQEFMTAYSSTHSKVNDVIMHDPVSVENSIVLPLPASRDQRTNDSKLLGGDLQESVIEYEKVLKPDYRQNLIPNGDAEILNVDGTVAGWNVWSDSAAADVHWTARQTDDWKITGNASFELSTAIGHSATLYRDITVKPNTKYKFTGKLGSHRAISNFHIYLMDSNNSVVTGLDTASNNNNAIPQNISLNFTTGPNITKIRVHLVKGGSSGTVSGYGEYLFADDLVLNNMTDNEWVGLDPTYQTTTSTVTNTITTPYPTLFPFTGGDQHWTVPFSDNYFIEAAGSAGNGVNGTSINGRRNLTAGSIFTIKAGGPGYNNHITQALWPEQDNGSINKINWVFTGYDSLGFSGQFGAYDNYTAYSPSGWDSNSYSPEISMIGESGDRLEVVAKNTTGNDDNQVFFATESGIYDYTESKSIKWYGSTYDSDFKTYVVPVDSIPGWIGANIRSFRFDFNNGGYTGDTLIKSIRFYKENKSQPELLNAGGGGSSGYNVNGLSSPNIGMYNHGGTGYVRFTRYVDTTSTSTITKSQLVDLGGSEPPEEAYNFIPKKSDPKAPIDVPGLGTFSPGNFLNVDYPFQVYFPNIGNFYGNGALGIAYPTMIEGKGFTDNMNTTEWTKEKFIKFQFPTIYNNTVYPAETWISLPVGSSMFDFYLPLAAKEAASALVQFKVNAINGEEDNISFNNKIRYDNYSARHSALKSFNIDVVGNIGNIAIEDTGDYRFSNLFKQPLVPTQWLIPNVVKKVDISKQNRIVGDTTDIRGEASSAATQYLNTWGLISHLNQLAIPLPLSPDKNNITSLQKQPMRLGYNVFADVQTTGNYYEHMKIIPYYYNMDVKTGAITPVDVYMSVGGQYKLINKFGEPSDSKLHPFSYNLNWVSEYKRRNFSSAESSNTSSVIDYMAMKSEANSGAVLPTGGPSFKFGTAAYLQLSGRNRSYIGTSSTYNSNHNPGNAMEEQAFGVQAQRWHFSYGLPSSAIVVPKGLPINQTNIEKVRTNQSVVLVALDIKAVGDVYALQYSKPNGNVSFGGNNFSLSSIPYPVISIYSGIKSSADDLSTSGTH